MNLHYEPLSLDKQQLYLEYIARCPENSSDFSFANVWGWAEHYGLEWAFAEDHVWIRQTKPEVINWAPIGPWNELDWPCCRLLPCGQNFIRVPETLALLWKKEMGDKIDLIEARGHWDYTYSVEELVNLKGNRFHKKKNHLNQFKKHYEYVYSCMDADCVEEVLEMQKEWLDWREIEDSDPLMAENKAICRVLTNWDRMPGMMGGWIKIDGVMVAYTVAEPLNGKTVVIHFEKGRPGYRGIYQAINQMFLENEASRFDYVNREQDLDDPGLRKSKLSYHPVHFVKKYQIRCV